MALSDLVDCSEMHIRHLERGKRRPSYRMLVKLAEAFGVDRDALLDETLFKAALEQIPKEEGSEREQTNTAGLPE